ncbi:MAG: biosynthetic peptidoglycan transglycosylase [Candidatus Eisenbacteria bacterium]
MKLRTGLFRWGLLAVACLITLGAFAMLLAPSLARRALTDAARRRGWAASFGEARVGWGPSLRVTRLVLTLPATGDTVVAAESLEVRASLGAMLRGHLRPAAVRLAHARIMARSGRTPDPDTLAPEERRGRSRHPREDRSSRVREAAGEMVRLLLVPARTLPSVDLRDVVLLRAPADSEASALRLERLRLEPERGGARLAATGSLDLEQPVSFRGEMAYSHDDRLTGDWTFELPDAESRRTWPLRLRVDGRVHQDRRRGRVELVAPTRFMVGDIAVAIEGQLERTGPSLRLSLGADSLSGDLLKRSLPPPVLGPLVGVATRGHWDYRVALDLDLAHPDSVDFSADVIPHGLALDPRRTRLDLFGLAGPFTARIHLPRRRIVSRELSPANPHFRTLDELDGALVAAVVTNEDGAFFRHRGFNTDAVKDAIAENIRAGAFKRGAGTITMQLARNLWLGHTRTLSRKAQEVLLAWTLEHLTGLSKHRLLEIYLNIIEWGPGIHGADEAARYYFDRDARRLSVDEALFLAILVPSPTRWRWRLDQTGTLRHYARAQMHFIGRAMIAKGWLEADHLPAAQELRIELRGPAREIYFPDGDSGEERARDATLGRMSDARNMIPALDLGAAAVSVSAPHPPRASAPR